MSAAQKPVEHILPEKPTRRMCGTSFLDHVQEMEAAVKRPVKPSDPYIIPGFIPKGVTLLSGASGSGKSGLMVNLATAVGSGRSWGGLPVKQGAVIYCAEEDKFGITERLVAACEAAGLPTAKTAIALGSYRNDSMTLREQGETMKRNIGLPVRLVVIDTLTVAAGGEDLDKAHVATAMMNQAENIALSLDCAVVFVHHPGKNGGGSPRGSQALWDRADAVIRVDRRSDHSVLTVEKMRNGPAGAAFRFEIGSHDVETTHGPINVQVIREVRPLTENDRKDDSDRREAYQQTDADVAFLRITEIAPEGRASLKAWRHACFASWKHKPSDGARKTAFSKAQARLIEQGKIAVAGDVVTVTDFLGNSSPVTPQTEAVSVTVTTPPSLEGVGNGTHERSKEGQSDG